MGIKYANRVYAALLKEARAIMAAQGRAEDKIMAAYDRKEITEQDARELLSYACLRQDQIEEWFDARA